MERLWTKPFIQMTVGMLFLFTAFYLLIPTLPVYIKQSGGSESQVGLVVGLFTLSAVFFRPIVGGLLDRYGRWPFVFWGLLFFALSMYMYDWAGGIAALIALRILHGASWAVSTTGVITAITDIVPAARRGQGIGWNGLAMTIGMAIGPMLGIWVLQNHSFHGTFLFGTGLSVAALLLIAGTKMPFQPDTAGRKIEFFEKSVLPVTAAIFFLTAAYGGITTFLPLFAKSITVNSGTFFLVYAVTLTLTRPVAGKLTDRYGESFVTVPALVAAIMALLLLSFSTGLTGVLASAVLFGIGFGSAQPALQTAALRLAHPDRQGVANASYAAAFDLGIGLGAIMLGWVSQYTGYPMLFILSAVFVAVSLFIFAFFVRRSLRFRLAVR